MTEGLNGTATAYDVAQCYRVFLGREAENETVIEEKVGQDRRLVMTAFTTSGEFGSQVLYRLIDGLPPATPLHGQPAPDGSRDWVVDFFAIDELRAERARGTHSLMEVLAVVAVEPDFLAPLRDHFGADATAAFTGALQSSAVKVLRDTAPDDTTLTLMCGALPLGALRRAGAAALGKPPEPDLWDFGLADFARLTGFDRFAIVATTPDGVASVYPLPLPPAVATTADPLGTRNRLAPDIRLADLWFATRRDLSLRFEGKAATRLTLDIYQAVPGRAEPLRLASGVAIGGAVSLASAKLVNPLAPVLLVLRDAGGAIRAFDHIPFPSLARGGLHAPEREVCGFGGDDTSDMAAVSADLLQALMQRGDYRERTVAAIEIDPSACKGTEPIFDADLLDYVTGFLGVAVDLAGDGNGHEAARERLARYRDTARRDGPSLLLPADAVPTLAALVHPVPPDTPSQTVTGSTVQTDWDRQGFVRSIWVPPLGDWLDGLQWRDGSRIAPMMRIGEGGDAGGLGFRWPLAVAIREQPVRFASRPPPFEIASEISLPLLRDGAPASIGPFSIVIVFDRRSASPLPLLESLARQLDLSDESEVLLCQPPGAPDPAVLAAMNGLFPDRSGVVEIRAGAGRIEQLLGTRSRLAHEAVLVVDAATVLTDKRTLATLATILARPEVATAGCLVRTIIGDKRAGSHGGYGLSHVDLRATPAFGFAPNDLEGLGLPATVPVAANSMAALATGRSLLATLPPVGSDGGRPAIDDLTLGLAALAAGGLNLCTSVVSVHTDRPPPAPHQLGRSLPYRIDAATLDRLVNATSVIQRIR